MPESREEVRVQLKKLFSPKLQESKHLETYVNIGSFLSDPGQYEAALADLNHRLRSALNLRLDSMIHFLQVDKQLNFTRSSLLKLLQGIRDGRLRGKQVPPEVADLAPFAKLLFSKLMSSTLYAWEKDNGFTHDPDAKTDILMGNPGKLFNEQLKAGRPFKDVGAGPEHGEFTHRIQWFLAGTGLKLENSGLVYRNIALWMTPEPQQSLDGRGSHKRFLWEFLFDRDGIPSNAASVAFKGVDARDFRAPSNLNRSLAKPGEGLSVLRWCLLDRMLKRQREALSMEYIEKKAPKHPDAIRVGQVSRAITDGTFDPERDMPVQQRVIKGLFIRRGKEIVDIDWQAPL